MNMVVDDTRNMLIMTGFLKLTTDDKLSGDDLVDEVVHKVEYVDVLAADVNGVARRDVEVVDVALGSIVKDVVIFLNDDVEFLIDIDVAQ